MTRRVRGARKAEQADDDMAAIRSASGGDGSFIRSQME